MKNGLHLKITESFIINSSLNTSFHLKYTGVFGGSSECFFASRYGVICSKSAVPTFSSSVVRSQEIRGILPRRWTSEVNWDSVNVLCLETA